MLPQSANQHVFQINTVASEPGEGETSLGLKAEGTTVTIGLGGFFLAGDSMRYAFCPSLSPELYHVLGRRMRDVNLKAQQDLEDPSQKVQFLQSSRFCSKK